jgi:hypothetical protein
MDERGAFWKRPTTQVVGSDIRRQVGQHIERIFLPPLFEAPLPV